MPFSCSYPQVGDDADPYEGSNNAESGATDNSQYTEAPVQYEEDVEYADEAVERGDGDYQPPDAESEDVVGDDEEATAQQYEGDQAGSYEEAPETSQEAAEGEYTYDYAGEEQDQHEVEHQPPRARARRARAADDYDYEEPGDDDDEFDDAKDEDYDQEDEGEEEEEDEYGSLSEVEDDDEFDDSMERRRAGSHKSSSKSGGRCMFISEEPLLTTVTLQSTAYICAHAMRILHPSLCPQRYAHYCCCAGRSSIRRSTRSRKAPNRFKDDVEDFSEDEEILDDMDIPGNEKC